MAMCNSSLKFYSAWPQPKPWPREAGGQGTLENVYILVALLPCDVYYTLRYFFSSPQDYKLTAKSTYTNKNLDQANKISHHDKKLNARAFVQSECLPGRLFIPHSHLHCMKEILRISRVMTIVDSLSFTQCSGLDIYLRSHRGKSDFSEHTL